MGFVLLHELIHNYNIEYLFIDNIGYTKTEVNKYFTNIISHQPNLPTQNPVRTKLNDEEFTKLLLEIGINKPKTAIIKAINERGYASGINRTTRILNQLQKNLAS